MDMLLNVDAELDSTMPLDMVPNYRGLTPFKLAAKKGNVVVRDIMHYPVTPIDCLYVFTFHFIRSTCIFVPSCSYLISQSCGSSAVHKIAQI